MKRIFSLLLCMAMLAAVVPLQALAVTETTVSHTYVPQTDLPDNNVLFAGYAENMFYPQYSVSAWGVSAREQLNSAGKQLYDWLKENFVLVANGSITSTEFVADSNELASWTGVTLSFTENTLDNFLAQFEYEDVFEALLHDCPYEVYWFDKTKGYSLSTASLAGIRYERVTRFTVTMQVSETYRSSDYSSESPEVSSVVTSAVTKTVANAQSIVDKYASLSDYEKLAAYRDEVCSLTEYNYDIANSESAVYGDPWQMIYVFDGDDTTKVVCEGYAKAFQYLCDITEFGYSDICCYSVVGTTNGGGHMWNIVTMHGGINYLADITNSDSGAIGQNGGLFLNGVSGSIENGYTASLSRDMVYIYNENEKTLWGTDAASILNLSADDFDPEALHITVNSDKEIVYDDAQISVDDIGYSIYGDGNISDFDFSYKWYADNSGAMGDMLEYAPENVGTYWLKVIAANKNVTAEVYSAAGSFKITPATLNILSAVVKDRVYDGTTDARLVSLAASGFCANDDVTVDMSRIKADFLTADAGSKDEIKLSSLALVGADAENYCFAERECTVSLETAVVISKAEGSGTTPDIVGTYEVSKNATDKFVYTFPKVDGVEYKMDGGEWTDSNVFDFIAPETEHTFYVRFKETQNHNAGVAGSIVVGFGELPDPDVPADKDDENLTLGDVNKSSEIDMMDYILLKRNYFGTFEFDEVQSVNGDINKSGDIDMMDYILLKRAYFGTFELT